MSVGLQPGRREQTVDLSGDAVHVRRSGPATPVFPDHPRVDIGRGNGLTPSVTSERQPRKLGRGRPRRLDRQLDHPSDQRFDNHRDDRADLHRGQVSLVQGDYRGIDPRPQIA